MLCDNDHYYLERFDKKKEENRRSALGSEDLTYII
jgi:hypothetical protein